MSGPWTIDQAREACASASRHQKAAEESLTAAAKDFAQAEEAYRLKLAEAIGATASAEGRSPGAVPGDVGHVPRPAHGRRSVGAGGGAVSVYRRHRTRFHSDHGWTVQDLEHREIVFGDGPLSRRLSYADCKHKQAELEGFPPTMWAYPAIKIVQRYRGTTLGFSVHHINPAAAWADFSRGWF